ncbi:MAG: hypothetical protein COA54_08430 [Thiotrichaceae bacterium]|nr:MAG: hypothetical protein COA54_08430 [Thiotrichaceae bacterium]
MTNFIIAFGAINAFLAVGAGAFGAHGLKNMLTPEYLAVFKTAADYQLIHGVGLILIGILSKDFASQYINVSAIFMSIGIILFSGSLYALTLSGTKWLGIITPIGGLCFLIAWLTLALNFLINKP